MVRAQEHSSMLVRNRAHHAASSQRATCVQPLACAQRDPHRKRNHATHTHTRTQAPCAQSVCKCARAPVPSRMP
eukprot:7282580-Alexandrium_andersonii.AAC.1